MTKRRFIPHAKRYEDYYTHQVGHGLPVFEGPRTQRGSGLGGLLGGLFRSAVPLLKAGAKTLGRQFLRTGVGIAQDALEGKNIKSAAKARIRSAGTRLTNRALQSLSARANVGAQRTRSRRLKRKTQGRRVTSVPSKRAKRSLDVFD